MKRVAFDTAKNKTYPLVVWNYAYREARRGHWNMVMADRYRFQRRISDIGKVLVNVLSVEYRERIYKERFCA